MSRQLLNRKGGWVIGIAVAVGLFVALNTALSGLTGVRIDLTEDRLYTLSDGTQRILDKMTEPVTFELYVSQRLIKEVAIYGNYAGRVRDVVNEFAANSNGKLKVVERDPEPFSEIEDAAVGAGVTGVPLDASGEKVYFGLAARVRDRAGVIGFFQPQREAFLEYDLARMLEGLINPKRPVIGVVTSLPLFGPFMPQPGGPKAWFIVDALKDGFDVRNIFDLKEDMTDDIDVLMLVHPTLDDEDLYAIDQFLMRKGRLLVFSDPFSELAQGAAMSGRPMAPKESNINKLTEKWGVKVVEGQTAGDISLARIVNAGTEQDMKPAPYLLWLTVKDDAINRDDAVTRDINAVNLGSAGVIDVSSAAKVKVEPLLSTTAQSQSFATDLINVRKPNVLDFVERFKPSGKPLLLAARLTGAIDSTFPEGPPEPQKPKEIKAPGAENDKDGKLDDAEKKVAKDLKGNEWPPHVSKSKEPVNIILVTDSDMLKEHFWVRVQDFFGQRVALPFANNGDFVVNALENLAGSGDLITLRSRGTAQRPFVKVEALRVKADAKFRSREQVLVKRLADVQKNFEELQSKASSTPQEGEPVLTPEKQEALDDKMAVLRTDLLAIRKELRSVQLELRKDIEALDSTLRFLNIGLVPILVGLFAIGISVVRTQRRKMVVQG